MIPVACFPQVPMIGVVQSTGKPFLLGLHCRDRTWLMSIWHQETHTSHSYPFKAGVRLAAFNKAGKHNRRLYLCHPIELAIDLHVPLSQITPIPHPTTTQVRFSSTHVKKFIFNPRCTVPNTPAGCAFFPASCFSPKI